VGSIWAACITPTLPVPGVTQRRGRNHLRGPWVQRPRQPTWSLIGADSLHDELSGPFTRNGNQRV